MKTPQPPAIAVWLLEHSIPGDPNEALAGDLLEEFRNGRTDGWYWSQVLVAVALGWFRESVARAGVIASTVLWSIAAPLWFVYTDRIQNDATVLNGLLCRLVFPWSMVGYFGWGLTVSMVFIWAGIAVYLLLRFWTAGSIGNFPLRRNVLLSTFVYIAMVVAVAAVASLLPPGHAIDRRTLTPLNAIPDLRMYAMKARFFCLVTLLVTLWAGTPRRVGRSATT